MKKRIVSLVVLAALIALILSPQAMAAETMGINDSLVYSIKGVRSQVLNGVVYVPIEVFAQNFGLTYSYDGISNTLAVSLKGTLFLFNLSLAYAEDESGTAYFVRAFSYSSTFMVPARFISDKLGINYSYMPQHGLVRMYGGSSMSDSAFLKLHGFSDSGTTTPPPDDNQPTQNSVYANPILIFSPPLNSHFEDIINSLDLEKYSAVFFVSAQDIAQNPEYIIQIVSSGHSVGIYVPYSENLDQPEDICQYINDANELLMKTVKTNTRFIQTDTFLDELISSEQFQQEILLCGYRHYNGYFDAASDTYTSAQRAVSAIMLDLRSSGGEKKVRFDISANSAEILKLLFSNFRMSSVQVISPSEAY